MRDYRKINKVMGSLLLAGVVTICTILTPNRVACFDSYEDQVLLETLVAQGYDPKVAYDEVWERKGKPDVYGTGGIDGVCKYGTYATGGKTSTSTSSSQKHTHAWGDGVVTKEPTCTEEGVLTYTCSCGKTKESEIPKLDHTYTKTNVVATCTDCRKEIYTCTCGDTYTIEFPEEGYAEHIYLPTEDSYLPTCTEPGKTFYVCNACGDSYEDEKAPLGHSFTKYTVDKAPLCTEKGAKSVYCDVCNEIQEGSTVPIGEIDHKEDKNHEIQPAAFWKDGFETVRCTNCGEILSEKVLPATGGNFRYIYPSVGGGVVILIIVLAIMLRKKK